MAFLTMAPCAIKRTHTTLRGLQFLSAGAALALLCVSFQDTFANGYSHRIGSPASSLLMVVSYSSMMYAMWFLACVELYPLVARPRILMIRAMDAANALLLLVAGLVEYRSDFVRHCGAYGRSLRCNNLHASVFFTFISVLFFVVSIVLTYAKSVTESETAMETMGYVVETTPTNAVYSPRPAANAPPTPSSKV